jgi:succinate dehydrogenase/fumarate reductase iron-sulfur protein
LKLRVRRFDPLSEPRARWQVFDVPDVEGESVLGLLQRIRELFDSTLAFRYGCRFKGCGLCTLEIDGRPLPACMIRAKEGMEVGPLSCLPVLRDLAVDRRPLAEFFARRKLHLVLPAGGESPEIFEVPPAYHHLAKCTECLACLATCPSFDVGKLGDPNDPERACFGGPLGFVKLAQLHFDPRDSEDRRAQARALGVATCRSCQTRCTCPIGVPIYPSAIEPLL